MASATFHNIVIQAASALGDVTRLEAIAAEIITPGELLEHIPDFIVGISATYNGALDAAVVFYEVDSACFHPHFGSGLRGLVS